MTVLALLRSRRLQKYISQKFIVNLSSEAIKTRVGSHFIIIFLLSYIGSSLNFEQMTKQFI